MNDLATVTSAVSHRSSRLGTLLASLVVCLAAMVAIVAQPGAASAAISYGRITACFQSSYTTNYGTFWGAYDTASSVVTVEALLNGQWSPRIKEYTNRQGCVSMFVQTGLYWRMRVDNYNRPYRYVGTTPYIYVAGSYDYALGTTRVGTVWVG